MQTIAAILMSVTALRAGATQAKPSPDSDGKTDRPIAKQISAVLAAQAKAWNRGDIDGFMRHYWKSDRLTFSSSGKTTRGWAKTKANYKRRYPTREAMGSVTFTDIEVRAIGDSAALVLGRWRLQRKQDPVGGNFTLVFRRIGGRWVIIHDHTSRDAKKTTATKPTETP